MLSSNMEEITDPSGKLWSIFLCMHLILSAEGGQETEEPANVCFLSPSFFTILIVTHILLTIRFGIFIVYCHISLPSVTNDRLS